MRPLSGTTATHGIAVAILGVGVMAVLFAAARVTPARAAEMTPAQTVAYRFPTNWHSAAAATPEKARPAPLAEDERRTIANLAFSPNPTYALASASSMPPISSLLPERTVAYADPSADDVAETHAPRAAPSSADKAQPDKAQPDKRHTAARPAKPSPYVFNDAQIASIKTRLKLTRDQQRYWPAVEAALRNIVYKKDGQRRGKMATVDPDSAAVQQLKSAAFPLIMTFSETQKDEVRQLARLMGLEQVASSF